MEVSVETQFGFFFSNVLYCSGVNPAPFGDGECAAGLCSGAVRLSLEAEFIFNLEGFLLIISVIIGCNYKV